MLMIMSLKSFCGKLFSNMQRFEGIVITANTGMCTSTL